MTVRCTVADAIVRYLAAQNTTTIEGDTVPLFGGVFAIFGHGNVAGIGPALEAVRDRLPTYRAHNEQAMAHAAIGFAKATFRRRMMACTTSIGPGATNLVTAAATAHVNRLPILLLPGDVFASRAPDPVLQQIEDFDDPNVTANDCLRPVSRFFDRITRPEQILTALPEALHTLTDPARTGPATIALPQDVQTEALDVPSAWFSARDWTPRRVAPDPNALLDAVRVLAAAKKPLIVCGGGVLYSGAAPMVDAFATATGTPVAETQAGKGTLPASHPFAVGGIGVTGTAAANTLAAEADVVLLVGTRLADFTTASRTLFERDGVRRIALNVLAFDAVKHGSIPLVADAALGLAALADALGDWHADPAWTARIAAEKRSWDGVVAEVTARNSSGVPGDAQVLGAVNRFATASSTVVCAAGGLPGELHKLWRATGPGSYHVEYGYSCMGYEIAGALGVKLAAPQREVIVMVGDGSYLMLNSELPTSIALDAPLIVVLLDNRGFGCINRLQRGTGGVSFNNLLDDRVPRIDFVQHAASLGAIAQRVTLDSIDAALERARRADRTTVLVIETDPDVSTEAGGAWWDVAVPAVSDRPETIAARDAYVRFKRKQRGDT